MCCQIRRLFFGWGQELYCIAFSGCAWAIIWGSRPCHIRPWARKVYVVPRTYFPCFRAPKVVAVLFCARAGPRPTVYSARARRAPAPARGRRLFCARAGPCRPTFLRPRRRPSQAHRAPKAVFGRKSSTSVLSAPLLGSGSAFPEPKRGGGGCPVSYVCECAPHVS